MDINFEQTEYNLVESRNQLLQFLLKLCESDVVAAINSFTFWVDEIALSPPRAMDLISMESIETKEKYELITDLDAIDNKLAGFYLLKENYPNYQIMESDRSHINPDGEEIEISYFVESGLKGLKECVKDITSLNKGERGKLPSQLMDLPLNYFRFTIGVVWGKDKESRTREDGAIEFIDYDRDQISGRCDSLSFWFFLGNIDEEVLKVFNQISYITHLNGIQKVLDDVALGRFNLRPELYNMDLLEIGILNRNEREFYLVDAISFKKAEARYWEVFSKQDRERSKFAMEHIEEKVLESKKLEHEGDFRAKEKGERLQALQNTMNRILESTNDQEKTRESEEKTN